MIFTAPFKRDRVYKLLVPYLVINYISLHFMSNPFNFSMAVSHLRFHSSLLTLKCHFLKLCF